MKQKRWKSFLAASIIFTMLPIANLSVHGADNPEILLDNDTTFEEGGGDIAKDRGEPIPEGDDLGKESDGPICETVDTDTEEALEPETAEDSQESNRQRTANNLYPVNSRADFYSALKQAVGSGEDSVVLVLDAGLDEQPLERFETIEIERDLTILIRSQSDGEISLYPDGSNRHLQFSISSNCTLTLAFDNVTLDGRESSGGVFSSGSSGTLVLQNAVIKNCKSSDGGGLYVANGALKISGSSFVENAAEDSGGGIFKTNKGDVLITGCTFFGNTAKTSGGGVYNGGTGNTILENNCFFEDNRAKNGGGIYTIGSTIGIEISECTFRGNQAEESGGGVYARNKMTIQDSRLMGNSADLSGSEVYAFNTLTLSGSVVIGNQEDTGGVHLNQAIFIDDYGLTPQSNVNIEWPDGGNVVRKNSKITPEEAAVFTYGDYFLYTVSGTELKWESNLQDAIYKAVGGTAEEPEIVSVPPSGVTLEAPVHIAHPNGDIQDRHILLTGGGVFRGNTMDKVMFQVYYSSCSLTLKNIVIDGKTNDGSNTASIIQNLGTLVLEEGAILCNNKAEHGGAVLNNNKLIMAGGEITGNEASYGGGVFNNFVENGGAYFEMSGGSIKDNVAEVQGSEIYSSSLSNIMLSGSPKIGNSDQKTGVFLKDSVIEIFGGLDAGAGICIEGKTSLEKGTELVYNTDGDITDVQAQCFTLLAEEYYLKQYGRYLKANQVLAPTLEAASGNPEAIYEYSTGVKLAIGGLESEAEVILEYRLGTGGTWTAGGKTIADTDTYIDISGLLISTGVYEFRVKQKVDGYESGYSNEVTIEVLAFDSPLILIMPEFTSVVKGYEEPESGEIIVKNESAEVIKIISHSFTPDPVNSSWDISLNDALLSEDINPGAEKTFADVKPEQGFSGGVYTLTVNVSYKVGDITDRVEEAVTFIVDPAAPSLKANKDNPATIYTDTTDIKLDIGEIESNATVTLEYQYENEGWQNTGASGIGNLDSIDVSHLLVRSGSYSFRANQAFQGKTTAYSDTVVIMVNIKTPVLKANKDNPATIYTDTTDVKLDIGEIESNATVTLEYRRGTDEWTAVDPVITDGRIDVSALLNQTGTWQFRAKQEAGGITSGYSDAISITVSSSGSNSSSGRGSGSSGYTVRFDSNGGSSVNSQSVSRNQRATEPSDPTREGYTFTGWYADEKLTVLYDFNKTVTESITLYAGWEADLAITNDPPVEITNPAYISGYPDGTFRPDRILTRGEAASLLYGLIESQTSALSYVPDFSDVSENDWYYGAVMELARRGIISGYKDGTFKPGETITRAEFVTMAIRYAGFGQVMGAVDFSDMQGNHWASGNIASAVSAGFVSGYPDGTFQPDASVTRAEAVSILNRITGRAGISEGKTFVDVPRSHWAYEAIAAAATDH